MWRILVLFVAVVVLLMLFVPPALSAQEQEKQKIMVKNREVNSGVVILTVQDGKNTLELQCNKNMNGCAALDPGEYQMVRLPKTGLVRLCECGGLPQGERFRNRRQAWPVLPGGQVVRI